MKRPGFPAALAGFFCGVCATVPMTLLMFALHRCLPWRERYPLPPEEITRNLAKKAKVDQNLNPATRSALSWLAHFGYGGAAGAIYANLSPSLPAEVRGPLFGLAVWVGSYFGLLPGLGILASAEKHPVRRSGLMLAAHLLWGWTLGKLLAAAAPEKEDQKG